MFILYMLLGAVGVVFIVTIGYLIGLRQFQRGMEQVIAHQHVRLNEFSRMRPSEPRTHSVLLDGISEAGKTTFITRLACPVANADLLNNIVATVRHYRTPIFPLCWEQSPEEHQPILHALRFIDVAGEKPSTFVNAINEQAADALDERVLVLIVWNLERNNLAKNVEAFNQHRLDATYGTDNARRLIKHVIVFFNKVDLFERQGGTPQQLEQEKMYIADLFARYLVGYSLSFYAGSAIDGRGVLDVYGEILRVLGLGKNFMPLSGNAPAEPAL